MADPETIAKARRNGFSAKQYVAAGKRPVRVDDVIDILTSASETGHIGVRRAANMLLSKMAESSRWWITAGVHQGGFGGPGRPPDYNRHISIGISGHSGGYHLQLTPIGSLRRVTGDVNVELVPPWLPPGAPIPTRRR